MGSCHGPAATTDSAAASVKNSAARTRDGLVFRNSSQAKSGAAPTAISLLQSANRYAMTAALRLVSDPDRDVASHSAPTRKSAHIRSEVTETQCTATKSTGLVMTKSATQADVLGVR